MSVREVTRQVQQNSAENQQIGLMLPLSLCGDIFTWGVAFSYLCGFSSMWVQVPGLQGKDGILHLDEVPRQLRCRSHVSIRGTSTPNSPGVQALAGKAFRRGRHWSRRSLHNGYHWGGTGNALDW